MVGVVVLLVDSVDVGVDTVLNFVRSRLASNFSASDVNVLTVHFAAGFRFGDFLNGRRTEHLMADERYGDEYDDGHYYFSEWIVIIHRWSVKDTNVLGRRGTSDADFVLSSR